MRRVFKTSDRTIRPVRPTTAAARSQSHQPIVFETPRSLRDDTGVVTKVFAVLAAGLLVPLLVTAPEAHADFYCELGNLLIPQEVHHVGTYRDATCAAVADIVATSTNTNCVSAVTNYVVGRGYDPYVGKDIALHNC